MASTKARLLKHYFPVHGKTFKFNKKIPVYKLPRGAIYKPPCVLLINNPFFAVHQVFALLTNTVKVEIKSKLIPKHF